MRTGIPLQYMKQINGKIEIHIRDMGTPTCPPSYLEHCPPLKELKGMISRKCDTYLIRTTVFDNFSAEIAAFDGSNILKRKI